MRWRIATDRRPPIARGSCRHASAGWSRSALTTPVDLPPLDQILPHRYPFLLVDRIDTLEPGRRIIGIKRVAHDEPFLAPGNPPVMPPTMIIESVAQVGAVLVLSMPEHQQKIAV